MKPHSLEQLVAMMQPYVRHVAMGRVTRKKARFGVTHWLTLDGRILRPDQMTNEHMINVVRMVARGQLVSAYLMKQAMDALDYAADAPDGAADAARECADECTCAGYETRVRTAIGLSPVIRMMAQLLVRRGYNPFEDHGPQPLSDYEGEPTLSRADAQALTQALAQPPSDVLKAAAQRYRGSVPRHAISDRDVFEDDAIGT